MRKRLFSRGTTLPVLLMLAPFLVIGGCDDWDRARAFSAGPVGDCATPSPR